jgi:peptidyl-prolyl cis-trans isomerase C
MRNTLVAGVALMLIASGCTEKEIAKSKAVGSAPAGEPAATAPAKPNPDLVLVDVNGAKLTLKQVNEDMEVRFGKRLAEMPAEQSEVFRTRIVDEMVKQFIARTLLMNEAANRGLKPTADEEAKMYDKIRASLPPGKTLEEMMAASPLGQDRLREELLVGLTIDKLLTQEMSNKLTVAEADIDQFIATDPAAKQKEQVHARHILLSFSPDAMEAEKTEKKQKIEALRKQIVDGADFAEVAKANSDCPSKDRGGDLGTFGRGQMVKPFEDAAFTQETNAVGPVIETQFGYHIVQTLEKREGGAITREQAVAMLKQRKQQELLMNMLNELETKANIKYGDDVKLIPIAPAKK